MKTLPQIGSKASVAHVESVCDFLHGKSGTITEHRFSAIEGETLAVIKFDEPAERHWTNTVMESCALRACQIA